MTEESHAVMDYCVLFTAQKLKKFKTWQDGTMKYYNVNRKLVLIDEKGYSIDRKFSNSGTPGVGDEIEFDGHIVTVETCMPSASLSNTHTASSGNIPANHASGAAVNDPLQRDYRVARKRLRTLALGNREGFAPENRPETILRPLSSTSVSLLVGQTGGAQQTQAQQAPIQQAPIQQAPIQQAQPKQLAITEPSRLLSNCASVSPPKATPMQSNLPANPEANIPNLAPLPFRADINLTPQFNTSSDVIISSETAVQDSAPAIVPPCTITEAQKRVRVGLSKRTSAMLHAGPASSLATEFFQAPNEERSFVPASSIAESSLSVAENNSFVGQGQVIINSTVSESEPLQKRFKVPFAEGVSVPLVLQFPSHAKASAILKSRKPPKRAQTVPTRFSNSAQYKDIFRRMIHEHLQILLLKYGAYFYSLQGKQGNADLERFYRSKGLGFYNGCEIRCDGRFHADTRIRLVIRNKENHAKYSKDDVWVVSKSVSFDPSTTFLGRSTFYGPFSDGTVEIDCVSARDARVASNIALETGSVYALRSISANAEFMMLDTLENNIAYLPLLTHIMTGGKESGRKKQPALPAPALEHIRLLQSDNINVEQKIQETAQRYKLNEDQKSVLHSVARSTITAPGWNEEPGEPVTLVHGVFGSGKSFLAAILVIFLRDIVDTACAGREPEDRFTFKILISSMTNVAVDRILTTLVSLGYDHFVRVGSLKKIAKRLLPYTAKAKISGREELKELEQMLEDPQNTEEDSECIAATIQRFRKSENMLQITSADVVGTTCMASVFEVFSEAKFPLVLLDESSQLMEPLTMVPLSRFRCNRLIMIGDPLQLPPTLATTSDNEKVGQGLDKTLFDRMTEMGLQSVMLRVQYRCHPRISALSNKLFYDHRLVDGVTASDRNPVVDGLPPLLFVDSGGEEQKSIRTNSFCNETELALSVHIIEGLMNLGVPASQIGVISLYKEQVDRLTEYMGSHLQDKNQGIQISTVDAFQGGEKEVILLSTVRTSNSVFIDNHPRVNVALTRAKKHLMILGNKNLLQANELWSKILNECQDACITKQELAQLFARLHATASNAEM